MKRLNLLLLCTAMTLLNAACEQLPTEPAKAQVFSDEAMKAKIPSDINISSGKLSLHNFVRLLAVSDESVRAQEVEIAIAQQQALGARGIFEPQFYASIDKKWEKSQTSAEDYRARGTGLAETGEPNPYFSTSKTGRMGLEGKNPFGTKMDLFYEVDVTRNSIQIPASRPSPEYTQAVGVSMTVPLGKNSGKFYNNAPIEIARIDQEIAQETSRLVKSQRTFDAIKTYLMVQRAQSRVYWRAKAYETAQALEKEMQAQVAAGLRSASEMTEASANMAEQLSLLTEARQDLTEQIGAFQIFFIALSDEHQGKRWMPSDGLKSPASKFTSSSKLVSADAAVTNRAETRINALRIEREEVTVLIAENQARPEFDLKLDLKKNFLSDQYMPFREVYGAQNPYKSWRVGFEFRRGILGDVNKAKELEAAQLRERQAELTMNAFRQRIASEMNGIRAILKHANDQVREQSKMVDAYWGLYQAEDQKSSSGQSSKIEVLNRKLAYYIAKEGQSDAIAQQNLSSYLASQVSGTLLSRMGVE